jgi:GGDEF domain-containing protein
MALAWLREVIRTEFRSTHGSARSLVPYARPGATADPGSTAPAAGAVGAGRLEPRDPFDVAARYARGEVEPASWYREWNRRWRGFQLPDRLHRYLEQLNDALCPDQVYTCLTEAAVQVIGGYTCVLFPPREEHPLRALPNPTLRIDAVRLTLSIPLSQPGRIGRDDVLERRSAALAGLFPLFAEEGAVSLVHAPFGEGGVVLLIERRQERVFGSGDWEMLRLLAAHASAALSRVCPSVQHGALRHLHPCTGLPGKCQVIPVLEHALEIASRGELVSLAELRLTGLERVVREDGGEAASRVRSTAADVLRELVGALGIVLHPSDDRFLLVLPRLNPALAEGIVVRLQRQLPARVRLRSAVVAHRGGGTTPEALLARLDTALRRATQPSS